MADEPSPAGDKELAFPTPRSETRQTLELAAGELSYRAIAEWIALRKIHKPVGQVFHTAYLADPGDADEIARGIEALVKDEGLRAGLRENGQRFASNASWERTAEATLEAYRALVPRPKHSVR